MHADNKLSNNLGAERNKPTAKAHLSDHFDHGHKCGKLKKQKNNIWEMLEFKKNLSQNNWKRMLQIKMQKHLLISF